MNRYLDLTSSYKFLSEHEKELDDLMQNSDGALYDGTDLVVFVDDEAKEYTVKEGTRRILDGAFLEKKKLEKITLPNTLEVIGCRAFKRCGIHEINMPASIKAIQNEAFMNCKLLKKLEIHESVLVWGTTVFAGCDELETVSLPNDMYHIPDWTFYCNHKLKKVKFPSNLLSIGNYAFGACFALEGIDLPRRVSSVGIAAFFSCRNIKKIVFPSSLKKIDGRCFQHCESLSEIVIPKRISFIGIQAFDACPNLKKVYIKNFGLADKNLTVALTSSSQYYSNGIINNINR